MPDILSPTTASPSVSPIASTRVATVSRVFALRGRRAPRGQRGRSQCHRWRRLRDRRCRPAAPRIPAGDYGVALSLFSYFGTMGHLTSGLPSNNCRHLPAGPCVHQGQYGIPCVGWPWRQLENRPSGPSRFPSLCLTSRKAMTNRRSSISAQEQDSKLMGKSMLTIRTALVAAGLASMVCDDRSGGRTGQAASAGRGGRRRRAACTSNYRGRPLGQFFVPQRSGRTSFVRLTDSRRPPRHNSVPKTKDW